MRLVLDTDVLLSSLRSTVGASRVLLLAVEAGVVTPLVSVATVIEYEAVLKRAEHLQVAQLDTGEVDCGFRRKPPTYSNLMPPTPAG